MITETKPQTSKTKYQTHLISFFFGNLSAIDIVRLYMYIKPVRKIWETNMAIQTTYTQARAQLASLLDQVTKNREVVIIQRRGSEDVAMITADELSGILETAHLLRSPKNARRLLTALDRARKGTGTPQTIDELREEVGFEQTS
jgi:antitoxin YefM